MDIYINYLPALVIDNMITFIKSIFKPGLDEWEKKAEVDDSEARYKYHVADKLDKNGARIYKHEAIQAIYDMIALCKELEAEPILFTPPYLHEYVDAVRRNDPKFFKDFYSVINEIINKTGIKYYDYSEDERYKNNHKLLLNVDHLNRNGARQFTNDILREAAGL